MFVSRFEHGSVVGFSTVESISANAEMADAVKHSSDNPQVAGLLPNETIEGLRNLCGDGQLLSSNGVSHSAPFSPDHVGMPVAGKNNGHDIG